MALTHYLRRGQQLASLGLLARKLASPERSQSTEFELASRMASMRGLPQKIGQILSMNKLQAEQNPFQGLSSDSQGMPAELAFKLIEQQLECPLGDIFESIDETCFAASLGQVHRARLRNGQPVALKIQYPNIQNQLEIDLKALGLLAAPLSLGRTSGFNLESYRGELRQSLYREIDYSLELATLSRMKCHLENFAEFVIPSAHKNLSTRTLLVMDWIEGSNLLDAVKLELHQRRDLAILLLRFFLLSWLRFGEIHADPHTGNFRFLIANDSRIKLGILDFGCTQILSLEQRLALYTLLKSSNQLSAERQLELFVQVGFDQDLLSPITPKLPELTRILFMPFHEKQDFNLESWNLSERIEQLLQEDRWNFRFAGPASLLGFVRALSGTLQYLKILAVNINWSEVLEQVEQQIDPNLLDNSVQSPTSKALPESTRVFCIEVRQAGTLKARLRFPLRALENLGDLMPPDLLENLQKQQIYPQLLADNCIQAGYPQGQLFQYEQQDKLVRVWLE